MRLLLISQYFWPEEFRINDLATELGRRGIEVTVLTGLPNYPGGKIFEAYEADPGAFASFDGVPVVRVPMVPRGAGGGLALVLNYLSFAVSSMTIGLWKLRGRRFDVAFVFLGSPAFQAFPAALLRILKGTPSLLWVQDLWPDTLEALGVVRSRPGLAVVGAMMNWLYRRAWGALIQSESYRADVERRAGPNVRVEYFPNWSEPNLARGLDDVDAAPETRLYHGTFNVMFAGNLGDSQDLDRVVDAAALCRDIDDLRWLIVGDGRARAGMQAKVADLGLTDRVLFLGRHPSVRMPEFFKAADAMLVSLQSKPIFAMTVPSKVQSYLAAGRPIVGMLDGEGARVLQDSGGGLRCPAGDSEGLASIVRRMYAMQPAERASMGAAGRAYALSNFDKDALIDQLVVWLTEAANGRRPPQC